MKTQILAIGFICFLIGSRLLGQSNQSTILHNINPLKDLKLSIGQDSYCVLHDEQISCWGLNEESTPVFGIIAQIQTMD
jgi:hypothetical protein